MRNVALIMAGGSGVRINNNTPKQYIELNGKPIIRISIEKFLNHPKIDAVKVVIAKGHEELYKNASEGLNLLPFVYGGNIRQNSVFNGLKSFKPDSPKNILIHDAARPFVSNETISNVIEKLSNYKAVDVASNIKDTIKYKNKDKLSLIDRNNTYATQTPQGFDFKTIMALHEKYQGHEATDDIALAINNDVEIAIVQGEENNFKITTDFDLMISKFIFRESICSHQ